MKPQTPKGFRDFLPGEARVRESVITTLKEVFSLYGFSPLETPAIEYASTLLDKYGEEADKLIYLFQDRGGRKVGLRYDLTVPLARVVASYQNELPIPFKRYQIAPVWRAEKPQAGRYREFWQADIDIVGASSSIADAEIVACVLSSMQRLGFTKYSVLINDRKYLDELGVTPELAIILDKKDKIGAKKVQEQLAQKVGAKRTGSIMASLLASRLSRQEPESIQEIKRFVAKMGLESRRLIFSPWLARGLEYYTGPIFEVKTGKSGLSIGGGGRYDELIGRFAGRDLPATGFSFGIDRVIEVLQAEDILVPEKGVASPEVLVTVFDKKLAVQSLKAASGLRNAGVATEVYPDEETKLDKQLKYANKHGIPWVVIIGPDEAKEKRVTVRNMDTGEQQEMTLEQLIQTLR